MNSVTSRAVVKEPCSKTLLELSCDSTLNRLDRWILIALVVVACLMFLPGLGATGIVNSSDGYYTEAAREMLERRDFITPYLNYEPFYEKPILIYWLIIGSYKLFGVNTFAARLPSALCAIASIPLLFLLTRSLLRRRAALLSAFALLTMPLSIVVGHVAITDAPLMLLTLSSSLLLISVVNGARKSFLLPAYIALGLAVLAKGPISILLVATVVGIYIAMASRKADTVKRFAAPTGPESSAGGLPFDASEPVIQGETDTARELSARSFLGRVNDRVKLIHPLAGAMVLLLVSLPWYVLVHNASHGQFTHQFFIEQNLSRVSGALGSHIQPWWFYIPYLFAGFFPWSIFLVRMPLVFRPRKSWMVSTQRNNFLLTCALATLLVVVGFSLSAAKLPTYLLPLAPFVAVLAGCFLDTSIRLGRRSLLLWTAPVMVVGGGLSFIFTTRLIHGSAAIKVLVIVIVSLLISGLSAYGFLVIRRRLKTAVAVLAASCYLACAILVPLGLLHMYKRSPAAMQQLLRKIAATNDSSVAIVAKDSPSAAFYAKQRVFEVDDEKQCREFITTTKAPHYLLVPSKHLADVVGWMNSSAGVVDHKGDWYLVESMSERLDPVD
ncbi:MAG: glycosyltransferase family 39 protein [Candidatus Obscuribacterales bacterium]|nr:glycosyltransferase family 39 protein [Candidatus Obscuribacterales bacterium]